MALNQDGNSGGTVGLARESARPPVECWAINKMKITMTTSVQLFRYDVKSVSMGIADPSITLIENDTAFSLLLAETASSDSLNDRLYLDQVTLFRAKGKSWSIHDHQRIALSCTASGVWLAQDILTGVIFHEPSLVPYHAILITQQDFASLTDSLSMNQPMDVFRFAQQHFGNLPGFSFDGNSLTTPDHYATASNRISEYAYACVK